MRTIITAWSLQGKVEMPAWSIGQFAVIQDLDREPFVVIHLHSGCAMPHDFPTEAEAIEAAEQLQAVRNDWAFAGNDPEFTREVFAAIAKLPAWQNRVFWGPAKAGLCDWQPTNLNLNHNNE